MLDMFAFNIFTYLASYSPPPPPSPPPTPLRPPTFPPFQGMQTICADQGEVVATQNLLAKMNDAIIRDKLDDPVLGKRKDGWMDEWMDGITSKRKENMKSMKVTWSRSLLGSL